MAPPRAAAASAHGTATATARSSTVPEAARKAGRQRAGRVPLYTTAKTSPTLPSTMPYTTR